MFSIRGQGSPSLVWHPVLYASDDECLRRSSDGISRFLFNKLVFYSVLWFRYFMRQRFWLQSDWKKCLNFFLSSLLVWLSFGFYERKLNSIQFYWTFFLWFWILKLIFEFLWMSFQQKICYKFNECFKWIWFWKKTFQ